MSIVAKKIMMGSGAVALPSDDQFNRVSFLSHFDGSNDGVNNAFDDGSTSNHTITANGNVTQGSFGPFARPDGEWGVSFDGSGDYFEVSNPTSSAFGTGDFTLECWVYMAVDNTNKAIVETRALDLSANGFVFAIEATGGRKLMVYSNAKLFTTSNAISLNTWTHIAISRSGTTLKCFINGTQGASVTNSQNYTNALVRVGRGIYASSDFNGLISNLRLVNSAVYTSNFTPPTAALTAITNTKLLACQSNRFVDNSASALTITPAGAPAVTAFGPFLTSSVYDAAVNGASASFDGDGDYLSVPYNTDFNFGTGSLTIECFIYPRDLSGGQGIYSTSTGVDDVPKFVLYLDTTTLKAHVNALGTGSNFFNATTSPQIGEWTHIAFVRNGSTWYWFINGVQAGTGSDSTNITFSDLATNVGYGGETAAGPVNAFISNFRVVKGTAVYTSNFTPPTAPLTAVTNTKLLLNMADGQAIDSAAQAEWTGTTVANGTPKLQTGQKKIGTSSLYFDGSSNYYFPNGFLPGGTGDFTIEFWFRASNTNDNATILTAGGIYFQFYNNELWYFPYNGSAKITSSTISTNTWYHVAGVRSGTTFYLFLDGTSQGTLTSVTAAVSNGAGYFGMNGIYPYTGYIDEMRISRMARYTSNFTPDTEPFADKGK